MPHHRSNPPSSLTLQPPSPDHHRHRRRSSTSSIASFSSDNASMLSMRPMSPTPFSPTSPDTPTPTDEFGGFKLDSGASTPPAISRHHSHHSPPSSSSALSLASILQTTQKYSSYTFLTFLSLHFISTGLFPALSPSSPLDASSSGLLLTRELYRPSLTIETLLIPTSLGLHIGSGLLLRGVKNRKQAALYGGKSPVKYSLWRWRNMSTVTRVGYLLVPLVGLHAVLMRWIPAQLDSELGVDSIGWAVWRGARSAAVSIVGMGALVGLGAWHVVGGMQEWWSGKKRGSGWIGGKVVLGGIWMVGLGRCVLEARGLGGAERRVAEAVWGTVEKGLRGGRLTAA